MKTATKSAIKKILGFAVVCAAGLSTAQAADLKVSVQGIKSETGVVYYALFDKAGFTQKSLAVARSDIKQATALFENLSPGEYAVTIYVDVNENGKLDKNFVGMPQEPYGFSNDAMGTMGPPGFEAAAIKLGDENQAITINLR
jgi:uncharacterized protein (DUF2141 family)